MPHSCSDACFTNFEKTIYAHVKKKVINYRVSDKRISTQPTISPKLAFELLKKSRGFCSICNENLTLHSWDYGDNNQFSFDRLDDSLPHTEKNLQITCLQCNIEKADAVYKPVYGEYYTEYYENLRNRNFNNMRFLHDQIYGNRKKNNWRA